MSTKKSLRKTRIKRSIRNKISGTAQVPRLSVFRSNTSIYAQLIDDVNGVTLMSASSSKIEKGTKVEKAKAVGIAVANSASEKGISSIVFDRNGCLYHGRVQALAEGAREGGLKF